jgi:hypothetical protein
MPANRPLRNHSSLFTMLGVIATVGSIIFILAIAAGMH